MTSEMAALVDELRERTARAWQGGSESARTKHTDRGKMLARDRIDTLARPREPLPRAEPAGGVRDVRRGRRRLRRAQRQHRHRHRARGGSRVRGRRERRHRQGRHLLPDHGQEAPARPGGGAGQQAPVHLPRRLRWRVPADAGRRVPRQGALRPDLLQPGQPVGGGDPPDRRRDGVLHGRGRLRPCHVGRVGDRQGPGHDLPRRTTAGEGRHRRGRHGRGARWRGGARAQVRGRRPPGRGRRPRAADHPVDRGDAATPPSVSRRSRR